MNTQPITSTLSWGTMALFLLLPVAAWGQQSAQPPTSPQPSRRQVLQHGTQKTVTIVGKDVTLIEEKTLPLVRGATGEAYYDFRLDPHEEISFELDAENANKIQLRLATKKDPDAPGTAKMQALAVNEALKHAPRQALSYRNEQDVPFTVILHLRGHVNYAYKLKIQRTAGK